MHYLSFAPWIALSSVLELVHVVNTMTIMNTRSDVNIRSDDILLSIKPHEAVSPHLYKLEKELRGLSLDRDTDIARVGPDHHFYHEEGSGPQHLK